VYRTGVAAKKPGKAAPPRAKAGAAKGKNTAPVAPAEKGFVPAGKGYSLGVRDGKLVCKNAKGQLLGSVPKEVRESDAGEQLLAVVDFLKAHEREVDQTVEGWMLRSLPTPTAVLLAVWRDDSYRRALENLVVVPRAEGALPGFLRAVDVKKGIGLVDADGETVWTKVETFVVPHPILLPNLEDLRALAAELGVTQLQKQLFREVFSKPKDLAPDQAEMGSFRGGKFEMLTHARGAAKSLGYRTSGTFAACRVLEDGKVTEARFELGGYDPDDEAITEALSWVDEQGETILVKDVPPIAFSEGMRMASAVYGKRVVEKKERGEDDA